MRSDFTARSLREAGAGQYVVLGAGLDTSAHYLGPDCATWLVDLPGVLAWRKALFAAAAISDVGTCVPFDLDEVGVVSALELAGLDPSKPVFFSWLGVTMYLEKSAIRRVLGELSAVPSGSGLVFDHFLAPSRRDAAARVIPLRSVRCSKRAGSLGCARQTHRRSCDGSSPLGGTSNRRLLRQILPRLGSGIATTRCVP